MYEFEVNQTKIKGSCQSGRKVVTHDSKSDLPLGDTQIMFFKYGHNFSKYVLLFISAVLGGGQVGHTKWETSSYFYPAHCPKDGSGPNHGTSSIDGCNPNDYYDVNGNDDSSSG